MKMLTRGLLVILLLVSSLFAPSVFAITSGPYTIGAAGDYGTLLLFEAAIEAQQDGDLTANHLNEETDLDADIRFDHDTNGNTLIITAASGSEHDGTYTNARIVFTSFDDMDFAGADMVALVEKLAFDMSASGVNGIKAIESSTVTLNRLVIFGGADTDSGIYIGGPTLATVKNCIVYDVLGNGTLDGGIVLTSNASTTWNLFNNTVIGCATGINQISSSDAGNAGWTTTNNLVQGCTTLDWDDGGGSFGTADRNVSQDGTEPGTNGTTADMHSVDDVFDDYPGNDFKLDSTGHVANLAILAAGADLSGTFTDDVDGDPVRSDFYIGADEPEGGAPPAAAPTRRRRIHIEVF